MINFDLISPFLTGTYSEANDPLDMNENALEDLFCFASDEQVLRAIENGLNIDQKVLYEGFSLMHVAAKRKTAVVAKKLLELGLDINECGDDDYTPLHEAVTGLALPSTEVMEFFLKNYAYRNALTNPLELTPLHVYVDNYKKVTKEGLKLLIDYGADLNAATGDNGETALHILCRIVIDKDTKEEDKAKVFSFIELLKGNGADMTIPDNEGITPENLIAIEDLQ